MIHTDYQHCRHKDICSAYLEDDAHCKLYLNHCKLARCLDDEGLRELLARGKNKRTLPTTEDIIRDKRGFEYIL